MNRSADLERKFKEDCENYYDACQKNLPLTPEEKELRIQKLKTSFWELRSVSAEENYFWDFCTFETYRKTLGTREDAYLETDVGKFYNIPREFLSSELGMSSSKIQYSHGTNDRDDPEYNPVYKYYFKEKGDDYFVDSYGMDDFAEGDKHFVTLDFLTADMLISIKEAERLKHNYIQYLRSKMDRPDMYGKNSLRNKLPQITEGESTIKDDNNPNKYPINIFKDYAAFELFNYLVENYSVKSSKTKYINLFHFLDEEIGALICDQLVYLAYINQSKNIHISKITRKTNKYREKTLYLLKSYYKLYIHDT